MKTVLVQQDIIWADPKANHTHLEELLRNVEGVDLIVLPEMFSTGFATSPEGIAESLPSVSLEWMRGLAARKDCAVAGSIAVSEDGTFRNRFCFVKPSGEATFYDKKHLFTFGGEDRTFTAGKERVVVEWRGMRFLLAVCYDLRFPVWLRSKKDYDAIICVASWPTVRRPAWDTLVRARAIENQCWMLAVDRTGDDPSCSYSGGTAVIDPYGRTLAAGAENKECLVEADLEMDVLEKFRAAFPVLEDADSFSM